VLDGPRIAPARGRARSLVVFLHGYGANGDDLIEIGRIWAPILPDTAFVSPHAPGVRADVPGGREWFPFAGGADIPSIERGVVAAAPIVNAFLDEELRRLGLTDERLVLVGFSQGTMMALEVGPRRKGVVAGIVGYSGLLAGVTRLDETVQRPPVLLIHGDADPLVPVLALHAAVMALGKARFTVEWHVSRGLEHGIDEDGLRLGAQFIQRVLS